MRFNNLKKYIHGISSKILTERLKFLEQDGYIERKMYTEVPIRVEYQLTDFGYAFLDQLISMLEWINNSMPEIQKKRHNLNTVLNLND
jgi:DNA-binding HxlR family transcriptional regulator